MVATTLIFLAVQQQQNLFFWYHLIRSFISLVASLAHVLTIRNLVSKNKSGFYFKTKRKNTSNEVTIHVSFFFFRFEYRKHSVFNLVVKPD